MIAGALFFYQFQSWKNRLLSRIKRMRQPKYLFGAIVGGLYFYWYFIRGLLTGRLPTAMIPPEYHDLSVSVGGAVLLIVTLLMWIMPHERASLAFSEAEVAFLFPAPVSRRSLIHFKLLKSQANILFTTLLLAFIGRAVGGGFLIRALGCWVLVSTINLHMLGSSFAVTKLMDRGLSNWKRRGLILGAAAVVAGAICFWVWQGIPTPERKNFTGISSIFAYGQVVFESGPLSCLLFPFRLMAAPALSRTLPDCLVAMLPALALMALHYFWVIRSNVAFEEASLDHSRKLAERIATVRAGNPWQAGVPAKRVKRQPFNLPPLGQPAVALLWKNLISASGVITTRLWFFAVYFIMMGGIFGFAMHQNGVGEVIASIAWIFLMMSLFVGPQILRQDLRQDLLCADILKLYPLSGWQVALGELLAPAVILTGVQWLLIISIAIFCPSAVGQYEITALTRLSFGFSAALLLPLIDLITLAIPNAAVLIFPAWFQLGKDAPRGIETMGQGIILMVGQILILLLALLPAVALFAGVFWVGFHFLGLLPGVLLGSIFAAALLTAEAWCAVKLLGERFDRFDLSAELSG